MDETYEETLLAYFRNPRNVGEIQDPDALAEVTNPVCGDYTRLTMRVRDGVVEEARFKTFGCAAAIAASSMLTVLLQGRTLAEAAAIRNEEVAEALGGLPPAKMHCSILAEDALRAAIADYGRRHPVPPGVVSGEGREAAP